MPKEIGTSTEATDDYLKAIFELGEHGQRASTSEIARRLRVSAASVTGMLQKMALMKPPLVTYQKRRGAALTVSGERRALEVIRHHRLLERFLHDTLGYRWDEVHEEAEKLEHFISEDFEERIAMQLGDPRFDPHGHPIPRKDGTLPPCNDMLLRHAEQGSTVAVSRVSDEDPEMLRFLARWGVKPQTELHVVERAPFEGDTRLRAAGSRKLFAVSAVVASRVWVKPVAAQEDADQ